MKKLILYALTFLIVFSNTAFALIELQEIPSDDTLKEQTARLGKFSFSAGFGRAYGLAGGMLLYDFPNNLGLGLSIGGFSLGGGRISISLRYNLKNDNTPIVLSPALAIFAQLGEMSTYRNQLEWQPGTAFSLDLRSYLGKYTYINNMFGLECAFWKSSDGNVHADKCFHTGIGIGFTFGGRLACNQWERDARLGTSIMTVALTLIHIVLSSILVLEFAVSGD